MPVIRIIFSDHNLIDVYKVTALDRLASQAFVETTSQNANKYKDRITQ